MILLTLQQVKADVTEGSAKLAEAIGSDSEAVICATGFRRGWDLFAPWKVCFQCPSNFSSILISIHQLLTTMKFVKKNISCSLDCLVLIF